MNTNELSYYDAGVDIEAGDKLVEQIKPIVKATHRPGVLTGLGGFGGLFELPSGYQNPVLVSGTDGVGTKLKLALAMQRFDTIGIDLVAMCVNDVIVCGAEPLYFLDYYATGHLEIDTAKQVIAGIAEGCKQAGSALIGGETAEMPGVYRNGEYDLAGFSVGIVEKDKILDPAQVKPGDALIAVASSGPHSNGYSLIRKILDIHGVELTRDLAGKPLGEHLLAPTRIYVKPILKLLETCDVHALAHITGGGIVENLPRVLPANAQAVIDRDSWEIPEIFHWLKTQGNINDYEMYRTFNCGVGMIACVPANEADAAIACLQQAGERAWHLGHIRTASPVDPRVVFERKK